MKYISSFPYPEIEPDSEETNKNMIKGNEEIKICIWNPEK
jgi:hypothetical protein